MSLIDQIGIDIVFLLVLGVGLAHNLSIKILGVLLLLFYLITDGFETAGFDIALLLALGIGLAPTWAFRTIGILILWVYLTELQAPLWWLMPLVILTTMIDQVVHNVGFDWRKD